MDRKVIELGIHEDQRLEFDQVVELARRKEPEKGILLYQCPCGCGFIAQLGFGDFSNNDALWFAKILELRSLGFSTPADNEVS